MRAGVFSDIHGNIYAFERTWKALKEEACDVYLCLGDICGYYYHQNEVIDILRSIPNLRAVRGNHDDVFLASLTDESVRAPYSAKYGKANDLLRRTIREDNLEFLRQLPLEHALAEQGAGLFHGSPADPLNGYLYPDTSLDRFPESRHRTLFLGHTHYPMDRTAGKTRLINPGSCGQPRDWNQASYAVFDFESGDLRFERIDYDREALIQDVIQKEETNPYLIEVLKRDRASVRSRHDR